MKDILRRIIRAEHYADVPPPCDDDAGPMLLRILGGLPASAPHATIGDRHVEARPGERPEDFEARCFDIASELGAPYIVMGGLSPLPASDVATEA